MLMRLLQLVAEGGVHSYTTIAGQLDVSTGLLEQMLRDLARMGYIAPVGGACDTSARWAAVAPPTRRATCGR